jgi:hypothetical protein
MEEKQEKKTNFDILKWAIIGILSVLVIILIFGIGFFVGEKKAKFSYRWAEHYHQMFAGPRSGFLGHLRDFLRDEFIEAHGNVGEIIKIEGNNLIIKGRNNIEKVIVVSDKTVIKSGLRDIKISDLKIGDMIVIIGSPNAKGQIEAKLIRVFPPKILLPCKKFYE